MSREHAKQIWQAAVDAVRPEPLVASAVAGDHAIASARRILVVGGGKAGPGMAAGLESALAHHLDRVEGLVNVPAGSSAVLKRIRLHAARPPGVNEPTQEGVAGVEEMLRLLSGANTDDVAICLLSGGGSALLPAAAEGVTLVDKLAVTKLLHRSGATIDEMNCVRKHLSRVKGGRMAEAFRGKKMISLIISDVVGDPLDVIASGPTAADPTTFAEAVQVLEAYHLMDAAPPAIVRHLTLGMNGEIPETPKATPANIVNRIVGSNRVALDAAKTRANQLGYNVLDLGSFIEGETKQVATVVAGVVRSIQAIGVPVSKPACILVGGETTVTLNEQSGKGGRNQEFVLAMLAKLGRRAMTGITIVSGGTDGEDGPTDAAGAIADEQSVSGNFQNSVPIDRYLHRHDAYHYFEQVSGLMKTGLTGTNVMDVRVVLCHAV